MIKTALISGGARGIGRTIARRFLERDYRVYILDIDEEELEYTTKVHLEKYSSSELLSSGICNLRDAEDIRASVNRAAEFLGGHIDVLVNNGGIANPKWKDGMTMFDLGTLDQWNAFISTNLTAPFAVSQACLPFMKRDGTGSTFPNTANEDETPAGPCIIHIGSFRALQSDPHQEGYAASKSGLVGLMHSMAISLQPHGIRVNLVAPGRIRGAHESKKGDEDGLGWGEQGEEKDKDIPAGRAGRPRDVADAVEYLVGAGFVTGEDITVDGGATRKK